MFHVNIQGLCSQLNELERFINDNNLSRLGLGNSDVLQNIRINGYCGVSSYCGSVYIRGGVLLFIHEDIKVKVMAVKSVTVGTDVS